MAENTQSVETQTVQQVDQAIDSNQTSLDPENQSAQIKEKIQKILQVINDPQWKLEKNTNNVKVYRLTQNDELFNKVKGVTEVPCTPEMMLERQQDIENNLPKTDPMCQRIKILKQVDDFTRICYASFKMPGPFVADRDFVFVEATAKQDDMYFSITFSVDEKEYGVKVDNPFPDCVRAVIHETGFMWREIKENVIELTYVLQMDPKGWIPTWVVNLVAGEQALNVLRVREHFEKVQKENQAKQQQAQQQAQQQ